MNWRSAKTYPPTTEDDVLCCHTSNTGQRHFFVADYTPSTRFNGVREGGMWSDIECTYVSVDLWTEIERPVADAIKLETAEVTQ